MHEAWPARGLVSKSCLHILDILVEDFIITVINVHIPDVRSKPPAFQNLFKFSSKQFASRMVIVGDFNAHIWKLDLTPSDRRFIGHNLLHDYCNENGFDLKNLIHGGGFSVKNTWASNLSLRYTWSNSRSISQIDHLLCNSEDVLFRNMSEVWVSSVHTNHKFLSATLTIRHKQTATNRKRGYTGAPCDGHVVSPKRIKLTNATSHPCLVAHSKKTWFLPSLATVDGVSAYHKAVAHNLVKYNKTPVSSIPNLRSNAKDLWQNFKKIIHSSAASALPIPKVQLSPSRLAARDSYRFARRSLRKNPMDSNS